MKPRRIPVGGSFDQGGVGADNFAISTIPPAKIKASSEIIKKIPPPRADGMRHGEPATLAAANSGIGRPLIRNDGANLREWSDLLGAGPCLVRVFRIND